MAISLNTDAPSSGGGAGYFSAEYGAIGPLDPHRGMPADMRRAITEHDQLVARAAQNNRAAAATHEALHA
jgi:hypothetical protein